MVHVALHKGSDPAPLPEADQEPFSLDAPPRLRRRSARADDAPAIFAHYARLSRRDRVLRFCGTASDASLLSHAEAVAAGRPRGLLEVERDPAGGPDIVRGMVEIVPDGKGGAELAISLERDWRGAGAAERLMRAAAAWSLRKGVARLTAFTLADNRPMRGLGRRLGAKSRFHEDGVDLVFDSVDLAARHGPMARDEGASALRRLLTARRWLSSGAAARALRHDA